MLELYQKESCPYSAKVRAKLEELEMDYIVRSMPDESAKRKFLKLIGGKEQLPLLIHQEAGMIIYESDDIIRYLELIQKAK